VGGAVAVVLVGVVVAALGREEEGGQDEEAAAASQERGKGEAVGVHCRGRADGLILASVSAARSNGSVNCDQKVGWMDGVSLLSRAPRSLLPSSGGRCPWADCP